jgi:hypothetical protein
MKQKIVSHVEPFARILDTQSKAITLRNDIQRNRLYVI